MNPTCKCYDDKISESGNCSSKQVSNTAMIIGIVVAILVVLIILVIVITLLICKKKK